MDASDLMEVDVSNLLDADRLIPLHQAEAEFRRLYIAEALRRNGGNRTRTARTLAVDVRTIFRHLAKEPTK